MLLRVFAARRLLGMPLSPKWWFSTTVQAVGEKVWDSKQAAKSAKKDGGTWTGSPVPGFGLSLQIYYDRMAMNYEYTYLEDRWIEKNFKGAGLHRWALELFCCNLGLILWYLPVMGAQNVEAWAQWTQWTEKKRKMVGWCMLMLCDWSLVFSSFIVG